MIHILQFDGKRLLRYDQAGNLVWDEYTNPSNPAREFSYDAENRIVSVKSGSGAELARYVYDADGRRVRRIVWNGASFVETWLVYGMEGELAAEYPLGASSGSPTKEYGYRSGQMLVVWDGTEFGD